MEVPVSLAIQDSRRIQGFDERRTERLWGEDPGALLLGGFAGALNHVLDEILWRFWGLWAFGETRGMSFWAWEYAMLICCEYRGKYISSSRGLLLSSGRAQMHDLLAARFFS